jgi:hypothetical protein
MRHNSGDVGSHENDLFGVVQAFQVVLGLEDALCRRVRIGVTLSIREHSPRRGLAATRHLTHVLYKQNTDF